MKYFKFLSIFVVTALLSACYSPKIVTKKGFNPTTALIDSVIAKTPGHYQNLQTIKGEGQAIVSEPNNSSHISIHFKSTRRKSLLTIRNRLGIKGGLILSTPDSLVIYNQIDEFVRVVPVGKGQVSRVNSLASINLVEILTVPVQLNKAAHIFENKKMYLLTFPSGVNVYIGKQNYHVQQIDQESANGAWSRIIYDAYVEVKGFSIPRRITIISADGSSRVSLLIQKLTVNPPLDNLKINFPDDIPVYRR